jgi:Zn-dependent protease
VGSYDVDWGAVAIILAAIVPSIILHEVSHGVVALLFGDDTAKRAGRLTLNPIKHVDPFGTVVLPLILALGGLGTFGYAKPVPVNVRKLRNPRQHSLYVSLAGPLTNITLALVAIVLFRVTAPDWVGRYLDVYPHLEVRDLVGALPILPKLCFVFGFLNVILAVFNLLPIPPLDGSAFIERLLPHSWWPTWLRFRQFGFGILLLLIFVIPGALGTIFDPALRLWQDLLV